MSFLAGIGEVLGEGMAALGEGAGAVGEGAGAVGEGVGAVGEGAGAATGGGGMLSPAQFGGGGNAAQLSKLSPANAAAGALKGMNAMANIVSDKNGPLMVPGPPPT